MTRSGDIFETHYGEYMNSLAVLDLERIAPILGLESHAEEYTLSLFDHRYTISHQGIWDEHRQPPSYTTFVIMAKYLARCPAREHQDPQWAAFKDFKRESHFTNVNYFASDTEQKIAQAFSGNLQALSRAARRLGGVCGDSTLSYDLVMQFQALPRIALLLLFNDGDDDFPPYSTVLFWRQAEYYLDPESLAMTSALLAKQLTTQLETGVV